MAAVRTFPIATIRQRAERREYCRLPAPQAGISRVELSLRNRSRCRARAINVSAGGLLCRLAGVGPLPTVHESLDAIHLFRAQEEPLSFTGTVRRVGIGNGTHGMFCAIEFSAILARHSGLASPIDDDNELSSHDLLNVSNGATPASRIGAENFVGRLYTVPTYSRCEDQATRAHRRRQVHRAFRDIVRNLPDPERWWFFHVVSVLKEWEPDYPEELLTEYLRLCRKGYATGTPPEGAA